MNKNFALSAIFLFLFVFVCSIYGKNSMNNRYVPAAYVVMANQIIAEVEAKLTKRYKMKAISATSGMAGCFNVVGLGFQIKGPLTKEQLRKILIDCVEEFLTTINANERLRPFLKTYPFTEKGIIITLFISDSKGKDIYDPEIMVATSYHGHVSYATKAKDQEFGYKQEFDEDYETAFKLVKDSK